MNTSLSKSLTANIRRRLASSDELSGILACSQEHAEQLWSGTRSYTTNDLDHVAEALRVDVVELVRPVEA